jgi:hypothetical protein
MFNLFSKVKSSIKSSFIDTNEVVTKIHNEFDTSTERILNEAKSILSKQDNLDKGEQLKSLGFTSSKTAVEATEIKQTKEQQKKIAERIEYFKQWYPNYKFITESEVEKICKKYGLLCGEVAYYTGDVPDKNLKEIASFKFRNEDCIKYRCRYFKNGGNRQVQYFIESTEKEGRYGYITRSRWGQELNGVDDVTQDFHYEKPHFKICATIKDFDMNQMSVTEGYKLEQNLPDPVVLQPVEGGYLVISKWGLEGEDESLINEKLN